MSATMTSKGKVPFLVQVMEKLRLKAGDALDIPDKPHGILSQSHRFNVKKLAPLRTQIRYDLPKPNFEEVRNAYALNPSLRD
ncbi:MAG: hypothetical protein SFY80_04535 [Verrucomicrobiota bacterium]|nr:hypothetical protein [Verrucomicrobiota bacterium]